MPDDRLQLFRRGFSEIAQIDFVMLLVHGVAARFDKAIQSLNRRWLFAVRADVHNLRRQALVLSFQADFRQRGQGFLALELGDHRFERRFLDDIGLHDEQRPAPVRLVLIAEL